MQIEIDLRATLMESAQCFRWKETPRGYAAVFSGRAFFLTGEEDFSGSDEETLFLRNYLDLDRDYAAVQAEFAAFPAAKRAMELYPGLRVLNQPAWETVLSFIISANNNVGRITKLVHALAENYGECVETDVGPLYGVPQPERLAVLDENELRALGFGYRAPYIIKTARMVADGFPLDALVEMSYEDAHKLLTTLSGVGDKVADCILLFGCRHASAFPVDVWVERLLGDWFGMHARSRAALKKQARKAFGAHGGLMQQYLFHAARMGAIPTER